MIAIYWKSGPSAGFTDLLPSWWFNDEGKRSGLEHDVLSPSQANRPVAKCSLNVTGITAELDYQDHKAHNERNFNIGVMKLTFSDAYRTSVQKVEWRDADSTTFDVVDAECSGSELAFKTLSTFDPTSLEDGRQKIKQMVTLRQGQPAFRKALMMAYERRCAITGCTIEAVLEAAHISPYDGKKTNDVTNGLLLRADIHTMFDLGLIKVYGDYRITAEDHIHEVYDLHEMISLPTDPACRPNPEALDQKAKIA